MTTSKRDAAQDVATWAVIANPGRAVVSSRVEAIHLESAADSTANSCDQCGPDEISDRVLRQELAARIPHDEELALIAVDEEPTE